jgi:hypothetical protein
LARQQSCLSISAWLATCGRKVPTTWLGQRRPSLPTPPARPYSTASSSLFLGYLHNASGPHLTQLDEPPKRFRPASLATDCIPVRDADRRKEGPPYEPNMDRRISHASAFSSRRVVWRARCSAPSHSASCAPVHKPRGRAPRRAADRGKSTPDALHSEWPYADPTRRIADARPPIRRAKTRHVAHDCG